MYFLSQEERKYVLRKLLPEARQHSVVEELRGWNWHQPPLSPAYQPTLGVYEIAGQYCRTGRDIYLRHVHRVKVPPNPAMIEGSLLHNIVGRILTDSKRTIYRKGPQCVDSLEQLELDWATIDWPPQDTLSQEMKDKATALWRFERRRIVARVEEVLSQQPHIGLDGLVALALPVIVEQRLDGRFLGLSGHLSVDAFHLAEPMVVDIKFGEPRDFHRLTTTGYALVLESLYEYPVTLGCIVYPSYRDGQWTTQRDFHIISDELRQWFIDARDERARLVEEEIDPGFPEACPKTCPLWQTCYPESGTPTPNRRKTQKAVSQI